MSGYTVHHSCSSVKQEQRNIWEGDPKVMSDWYVLFSCTVLVGQFTTIIIISLIWQCVYVQKMISEARWPASPRDSNGPFGPGPYPSQVPVYIYELLNGKGRFSLATALARALRREVINDTHPRNHSSLLCFQVNHS